MTLRRRESAGANQIAQGVAGAKNQLQRAGRAGAGKTTARAYAGLPVQAKTANLAASAADTPEADTPDATIPPLAFDPFQLVFEQHAVGITSPPKHALLRNYGEWPVTVPDLALDGQASHDFILATRGPLLVEPGDFAPVELSFAPSTAGDRSAALNAPGDDDLGATLLLLGIGEKAAGLQPSAAKKAQTAPAAGATQQPAPQGDMDASALASIQVVTRTKHVLMLEPWRISEKHKKNTQQKKRFYKRLDKAKRALRTAEQTLQAAAAGKAKEKALQAFQAATAEAEAATLAFRDHVIAAYWQENKAGQRTKQLEAQQQALVSTLAARAKTDKSSALAAELDAARSKLLELVEAKSELYRNTELDVESRMDMSMQERAVYAITIDGEVISLHDHVNAYATDIAAGLDGGAQKENKQGAHQSVSDALNGMGISESLKKILQTISENEGGFSTVNTYDRAVVTWGFMQWTGGDHSDLTQALHVIKQIAPDAFAERFQRYGIDVQRDMLIITDDAGNKHVGKDAAKVVQPSPEMTAVFARAGLDKDIQRGQVEAAVRYKIDKIIDAKITVQTAAGKIAIRIGDIVTSEYGVGLLADHAVHGGEFGAIRDMRKALVNYLAAHPELDPASPSRWASQAESDMWTTIMAGWSDRAAKFLKNGCSQAPGSFIR